MVSTRGLADELPRLQDHVIWGLDVFPRTSEMVSQLQAFPWLPTALETRPAELDLCWSTQCHLLPFAPFSLCLLQPHWPSWVVWSQAPSCLWAFTYPVLPAWNVLPPVWSAALRSVLWPSSQSIVPGLGLYHFHLHTSFTACVHSLLYFLSHSLIFFVLCDSPLSPSPFILRFMSREILFFLSIPVSLNPYQKLDKFIQCVNEWMSYLKIKARHCNRRPPASNWLRVNNSVHQINSFSPQIISTLKSSSKAYEKVTCSRVNTAGFTENVWWALSFT